MGRLTERSFALLRVEKALDNVSFHLSNQHARRIVRGNVIDTLLAFLWNAESLSLVIQEQRQRKYVPNKDLSAR
jgi:hypothetical protein